MKVYIASKYQERDYVRHLMGTLVNFGHTITVDWTNHDLFPSDSPAIKLAEFAVADVGGVRDAQVYIGVFLNSHHYRGALVEWGMALGLNKPCLIMGHAEDDCIFINHPLVQRIDGEVSLLKVLEDIDGTV